MGYTTRGGPASAAYFRFLVSRPGYMPGRDFCCWLAGDSIMARGRAHSDEVKAEVMGALLAGMSVTETARKYSLDKSIVSRIRSTIADAELQQVATEREFRIDEMLAKGLQGHLKLQLAIVSVCADENYIRDKNPADIAKLLEVSTAHSIRLLEAASAGAATDDRETDA